eukprot:gnl/Spiro4/26895_TR13378_c0_g2_i1.p1 gnl/Spiro4/26895_TR13378_c0_g2~~gnl/Spiro4/26895_TR13378_c0_g2_i1.p1  ORF type:complete len:118 (-),score=3.30 gnl/Spiro4/26895_TR13378_c0_g2_i1:104-457(-)
MSLLESLLSLGLLVPLSTVSVRLLIDSVKFMSLCQARVATLGTLHKLMMAGLTRHPFEDFSLRQNSLYLLDRSPTGVVDRVRLICHGILSLSQTMLGVLRLMVVRLAGTSRSVAMLK